ncbi:MAG: hypothetical protein ABI369_04985 [Acetobacteraceae bacterium]
MDRLQPRLVIGIDNLTRAAVYLAGFARQVTMLVRGPGLSPPPRCSSSSAPRPARSGWPKW